VKVVIATRKPGYGYGRVANNGGGHGQNYIAVKYLCGAFCNSIINCYKILLIIYNNK
jgi:hypothetical protein